MNTKKLYMYVLAIHDCYTSHLHNLPSPPHPTNISLRAQIFEPPPPFIKFSPVSLYFPPLNKPVYFRYAFEVACLQLIEIQGSCQLNYYVVLIVKLLYNGDAQILGAND